MRVHCRNPNVFLMEQQDLIHQATLVSLGTNSYSFKWIDEPITFYSDLTNLVQILFFARRSVLKLTF